MPVNKLSPFVQAFIVVALLAMFAGVLFAPLWAPQYKMDDGVKQTLFALVTAAVFFFIGKTTGALEREAATTNAAITNVPAPGVGTVTTTSVQTIPPATTKKVPTW